VGQLPELRYGRLPELERRLAEVLEVAEESGRLEDATYGSRLGMEGEEIVRASEMVGGRFSPLGPASVSVK
jgi:precorrin-2 methylase